MQVYRLVRIQFREALLDLAERHERGALDLRDLEFILFPDVDHGDTKVGVVECAFHFLHVHLIRIFIRFSRLIRDAAELVVVDQLADTRVVAADRALWIAPQLDLAILHLQRIEDEQPADERVALAKRELDDLGGLDAADDARQHAEHAALGAAWHHARWRRFRVEAAVARAAEAWGEHACLSVEAKN